MKILVLGCGTAARHPTHGPLGLWADGGSPIQVETACDGMEIEL